MDQNKNTDKNEDANNQVEDENTTSVNDDDNQSKESTSINEKDSSNNEENLDNNEIDSQDEIKDLKDQLLRTLAENENLRKRTAKEIEQVKKYGHISLLRDFLNVVDNMERAIKSSTPENKSDPNVKNLMDGIEIVLKEMKSILDKNQIKIKQTNILQTKGQVNFIEVQGEIKGLGTKELSKVLEMIESSYPHKTNAIELSKNSKNNLLNIYFDYEARGKK